MVSLVGILNLTPDSFLPLGRHQAHGPAISHARQLFHDGASFIDVGAESTRPGATPLNWQAEWSRLWPVLAELLEEYPGKVSIDSYHPETVARAFEFGSIIINDVTAFQNPKMVEQAVIQQATVICSHLPAPSTDAAHSGRLLDSAERVAEELYSTAVELEQSGVERQRIILDPGIGFGKTVDLNWRLLEIGDLLPDYDVMIGYSCKRFLGDSRFDLQTNLSAGRTAAKHGATYLRVHDVAGHSTLVKPRPHNENPARTAPSSHE